MRQRHLPAYHSGSLLSELRPRMSADAFEQLRRALRPFVGRQYRIRVSDIVHPDQLAVAVKLLGDGMTRAEAKDALIERLGVSRQKAYRLLDQALEARRSVVPPMHADYAGLAQLSQALSDDQED